MGFLIVFSFLFDTAPIAARHGGRKRRDRLLRTRLDLDHGCHAGRRAGTPVEDGVPLRCCCPGEARPRSGTGCGQRLRSNSKKGPAWPALDVLGGEASIEG